jgi:hypothetical protein
VLVAGRWFGLRGLASSGVNSSSFEAVDPLTAGFQYGWTTTANSATSDVDTRLFAEDALSFVSRCADDSYACCLIDVYTNDAFPPSLLTEEFFNHLRRISKCIVVNAGADER